MGRNSIKESEEVEAWNENTNQDIEIKQGFSGEDVSILGKSQLSSAPKKTKLKSSRKDSLGGSNLSYGHSK